MEPVLYKLFIIKLFNDYKVKYVLSRSNGVQHPEIWDIVKYVAKIKEVYYRIGVQIGCRL